MTSLGFYGAAHEVTGSNYLLKTDDGHHILVDCGYFQGGRRNERRNYKQFHYDPEKVTGLILTHAHLDHSGRLPKLVAAGFKGPIYATPATIDLAAIVLEDAAHLMTEAHERYGDPILYTPQDLTKTIKIMKPIEYHSPTRIAPTIEFEFYDAGHILGSTWVKLTIDGKTIVFTGDMGNPPVPFLRPTELPERADYLLTESTYGGRVHESDTERMTKLKAAITQTIGGGGTLMIPSFAIERTQEVIYMLDQMYEHQELPHAPVFLDSPLAIKATAIFRKYARYYNQRQKAEISSGEDLLKFPDLKVTLSTDESKTINEVKGPKIIIAGAGMMNGGRILHHAKRYLPDPKSQLLIIGYQVENSIGRQLLDGARRVKIHHQIVPVRAKVSAIGAFSAHADQPKLLKFAQAINPPPKKIFITHGEVSQSVALSDELEHRLGIETVVPPFGSVVEL
ncbi:MAG: MBL fold metallo-hydrolase [Patescibacteria group bacterium]|nr:MBL fold metallo-hydrolase [Patescibacteria group bacterium]